MPRGTNPALEIYLNLIYPWEPEYASLYKCVAWTFVKKDSVTGEKGVANFAAVSLDDLMRLVESRAGWANTDVYLGLGAERMASIDKFTKDGFPRAIRQTNNIVSHRSIFLDIDAGNKGYATTDDAFAALDDFCDQVGLPPPTMEVLSGSGGVHVYWCMPVPASIDQWIPLSRGLRDAALAYGLQFDPQCTVNAAQILRAPNSWNFKRVPPTRVTLLEDSSFATYDYQQLVGILRPWIGQTTGLRATPPAGMPAMARSGTTTQNFTENVPEAPPVAIDDVAPACGVISDILDREGNGDSEPLWNLALMLASFTSDPVDAAHRMSRGDSRYVPADTDKKLHEKINARAANPQIGWPQCSSFSPLHAACATCPLFVLGKSPLNFAQRPQVQAQIQQFVAQQQNNQDPIMPVGYWRDVNQHVYTTITDKEGNPHVIDVLGYPILDAGIDPEHGHLVVRTKVSGVERWGAAAINTNMQPVACAQTMAKGAHIFVKPINHKDARDFLVAWMTRLQEVKKLIQPSPFGWTDDGSGFTFGDKTYYPNKVETVFRGATDDGRFMAKGTLQPWTAAFQLVDGNGPLECVVASAFAAPLVKLTGLVSLVMSVYSHLSGIGKSTSMQIAQAVWGNPRTGMSSLDDTYNSVIKKISDLHSLPVYWDELRTHDDIEKAVRIVFGVTQGKGKSRLTRDSTQQAVNAFTTLFCVASNYGLADHVYSQTEATEAGGLRIFEIEAQALHTQFADWQARQLLLPLETNYGAAGALYAQHLAANKARIQASIQQTSDILQKRYNFDAKERFWAMTYCVLIVGAAEANRAGVANFDLARLDAFLDGQLAAQRAQLKREEHQTFAAADAGHTLLSDLLNEHRGKNAIITDVINYGRGKPLQVRLHEPTDVSKLGDIWIQASMDGKYRIRVRPFQDWLRKRRLQPDVVLNSLKTHYFVSQGKQSIGVGVPFLDANATIARSACYDFTPLPSSPFYRGANHGST